MGQGAERVREERIGGKRPRPKKPAAGSPRGKPKTCAGRC